MRLIRPIHLGATAIAAVLLVGTAAPAQAENTAYRADSEACAKAKAKVQQAKERVREAKSVGGTKLKRAKKKLKRAKAEKRRACATSVDDAPGGAEPVTGPAWRDGRYQGTYAENNADLAFNVVGTRLFTGPFDGFYLDATCQNVDPEYTGPDQVYTDTNAIEPVEAMVGPDGSFSGQGTYRPGTTPPIPWKISGQIAGGSIPNAQFSATYTDVYGNPCSGTTSFTASWYGDYTL